MLPHAHQAKLKQYPQKRKNAMLIVRNLRERMVFFINPINPSELTLFAQELQSFLSPIVLQEIAKKVSFVQRSSKYQANELFPKVQYFTIYTL